MIDAKRLLGNAVLFQDFQTKECFRVVQTGKQTILGEKKKWGKFNPVLICVQTVWDGFSYGSEWRMKTTTNKHFFHKHTLPLFIITKMISLNMLVLCTLFSQIWYNHVSREWDSITDWGKQNISLGDKCFTMFSNNHCNLRIHSVKQIQRPPSYHHIILSLSFKLNHNYPPSPTQHCQTSLHNIRKV